MIILILFNFKFCKACPWQATICRLIISQIFTWFKRVCEIFVWDSVLVIESPQKNLKLKSTYWNFGYIIIALSARLASHLDIRVGL